jgi:IclR family pca regulon transcriptional regulator
MRELGGTMSDSGGEPHRYRVDALAKGLRVLGVFEAASTPLKTSGVATELQLPVASTFRIVATLEEFGFLERTADGAYRLGLAALRLGGAASRSSSVLEAGERPLRVLADSTGRTANLGVLVEDRVLYLARLRNADLVTANVRVGSTLPAAYTSMGKMLLSYLNEAEIRSRMTGLAFPVTHGPNAVRGVDDLLAQLAGVRAQGFAVQDEELARGLRSISVGVIQANGSPVAAINLAVAADETDLDSLIADGLEPLRRAAAEIAMRLEN